MLNDGPAGTRGYRRVIIGPDHPYVAGGLPMDAPGVGLGQNDGFAYQARAFLDEVAGLDEADSLPPLRVVRRGRAQHGDPGGRRRVRRPRRRPVRQGRRRSERGSTMKFGVYNAILHDRSLPEALEVIAGLGLTGIELNSGGFLPAGAHPDLRRHPDLRHGARRLPRPLRGHRCGDRRAELQRQPAAPRSRDR